MVDGVLLGEFSARGDIVFLYDESGSLYGFTRSGTYYYYAFNGQGDVIGIYDADGDVVAKYSYDTWGVPRTITDGSNNDVSSNSSHIANINPIRYRGYYYDIDTGFYYLQSRYYDPVAGRFINADGQLNDGLLGYNLFAYCLNNPVNMADLAGEIPVFIYGDMHRKVLKHICENNQHLGLKCTNTYIDKLDRRRYCDLYSSITYECWELKHKLVSADIARLQLDIYVSGILKDGNIKLEKATKTSIPEATFNYTNGIFSGKIRYWDAGEGILRYEFIRNDDLRNPYAVPEKANARQRATNYGLALAFGIRELLNTTRGICLPGGLPAYCAGGGHFTLQPMYR